MSVVHKTVLERKRLQKQRERARNPGNDAIVSQRYREGHRAEIHARNHQRRQDRPERTLFEAARVRAAARGVPFSISIADVFIPSHCPISGIPIHIGSGKSTDNSPSLDRIENSKGYVKGNVIVVSWMANRVKNNVSVRMLMTIARGYARLEADMRALADFNR